MKTSDSDDEMRPEYDFSKGVRGKYAARVIKGARVVVLDPDVADEYPSSEAVNDALRKQLTDKRRTAG